MSHVLDGYVAYHNHEHMREQGESHYDSTVKPMVELALSVKWPAFAAIRIGAEVVDRAGNRLLRQFLQKVLLRYAKQLGLRRYHLERVLVV